MDREVHGYADCQVTYRNCQEPPSKSVLAEMIAAEAKKRGVKTGLTEQNLPEKSRLLLVLATFNPEHRISKSYRPEKPASKNAV